MEERKQLVRELNRKFIIRELPYILPIFVFMALTAIGVKFDNSTLLFGGLALCFINLVVITIFACLLGTARQLMMARALVGRQISADPIKEGRDIIKHHGGYFGYKRRARSFNLILMKATNSLTSATSMLEKIPYLGNVAAIANYVIRRANKSTTELLSTYEMAYYESNGESQFYDLLTLLVQHGKDFILKILKLEVRNYIVTYVPSLITVIVLIVAYITRNPFLIVVGIIIAVPTFALILFLDSSTDMDILCDYIQFVESHEVNQDLKHKLQTGLEIGNDMLRINDAVDRRYVDHSRVARNMEDIAHRLQ